jgi:hypothetical protein
VKTLRVLGCVAPLLLACSTPQTHTDKSAPSATPVAAATSAAAGAEALWKHPGMDMSFRHPTWLKVQQKPDGAWLQSDVLAEVEDRSTDTGPNRPTPFVIVISVGKGKLLEVMKRAGVSVDDYFPTGREDGFKAGAGAERATVAGKPGYSILAAVRGEHSEREFAEVAPGWIVEVECRYVADKYKPKVPVAAQAAACGRVISTLAIKL